MKKTHRAPKTEPVFKKYWNLFLPQVIERKNFKDSHLEQLHVLCDLFVDYHRLTEFINENGYSFLTDGRYGQTSRPHVETQVRMNTVKELRAYLKSMGLILDPTDMPDDDEGKEWE
jgi:phage terminase small subunit